MSYQGNPCWYELGTGDPDAARPFYAQVLGWDITDAGMKDFTYLLAKSGGDAVAEDVRSADGAGGGAAGGVDLHRPLRAHQGEVPLGAMK